MKRFLKFGLVALVGLLFISSCASLMPPPEEMKTYEAIINLENMSKDEIFVKSNSWFVEHFVSAESVIQYSDKDAGKIMGKYVLTEYLALVPHHFKSLMSIDIKDHKVRVVFKDAQIKVGNGYGWAEANQLRYFEILQPKWKALAKDLEEYLKNDSSDW